MRHCGIAQTGWRDRKRAASAEMAAPDTLRGQTTAQSFSSRRDQSVFSALKTMTAGKDNANIPRHWQLFHKQTLASSAA
jgi:hypothetical protein